MHCPGMQFKRSGPSGMADEEKSKQEARPVTERKWQNSRPGRSDMATLTYAGIGAPATPANVLVDMTVIAGWLAPTYWHLSSGGTDGADTAFAGA